MPIARSTAWQYANPLPIALVPAQRSASKSASSRAAALSDLFDCAILVEQSGNGSYDVFADRFQQEEGRLRIARIDRADRHDKGAFFFEDALGPPFAPLRR